MKKLYTILLGALTLSQASSAQVTVINPNTDGGFEVGPPFFGASGWSTAQSGSNQWALGSGSVSDGSRGAYIGNGSTFFGTNSPVYNHLYRFFPAAIPATATNVLLSFRYRQPVADPANDSFIVSVNFTSTATPSAGSPLPADYSRIYENTNSAYPGYITVGPIDLSALAGSSVRLAFTYVNNGSSPIGVPAIDSISLTYCNLNGVTGTPTMCVGATSTLSCTSGGGTWSSANPAIATVGATTGTSTTVTGVTAGTAVISYTVGDCASTMVVTVNPLPSPIGGTPQVCNGSMTTLTDITPGGTWSSSTAGIASISSGGVVSGVAPGTSNISYTLATGCYVTQTFTVNALPAVYSVTGGGSYCISSPGVTVNLSGSDAGITYSLSDGTSTVATTAGSGGSLSFGLFTVAGTYTASATNPATGCSNDMSGSATITIATPVVPSVSVSTSPSMICAGASATFVATPVNGGATPTYQWYVNGTAAGTGSSYSYVPAAADVVAVTLHPGNICTSPDTASGTYIVALTPYSTPGISIAVSPGNPSCLGDAVTFSSTPSFGGATPAYRWTKNGINVATGPTYSYIPANGDMVYCHLTSDYLCRTTDTALSSTITMIVEASAPVPTVNIAASPGTNITPGETVTLTSLVAGGGPVTYQWLLNGVPEAGATSAVYMSNTLVNGDLVTCQVTNSDACAKSSLASVLITTGASYIGNNNTNSMGIEIFPNPNKGAFTIRAIELKGNNVKVRVTDITGRNLYMSDITTNSGTISVPITLKTISAGMYILHIETEAMKAVKYFSVTN